MKKIPTLFERTFENHKVSGITEKVTPGMEWVLDGEGLTERVPQQSKSTVRARRLLTANSISATTQSAARRRRRELFPVATLTL